MRKIKTSMNFWIISDFLRWDIPLFEKLIIYDMSVWSLSTEVVDPVVKTVSCIYEVWL